MKLKKVLYATLCAAMVLSIMGFTAYADTDAVAKIGETEYKTLEAALAEADADDTVTLLNNITANNTITINRSVALELGDYTITGNNDSGEAVLRIYSPVADTTINVTINAGNGGITNTSDGYALYSGMDVGEGKDEERTNLTINGGNYVTAGSDCVRQIMGLCTINGGTYKSAYGRTVLNGERWYGAEFAINGGRFYGFNPACVSVWTGFDGKDYTNFYHIHDIIADGKTSALDEEGWYTVIDGSYNPKASTKSLCYHTVGDAINAVSDLDDLTNLGTITLLQNDELNGADAELAFNKGFTFETAGHTLWLPMGYALNDKGRLEQEITISDSEFEANIDSGYYGEYNNPNSGVIVFNSFYNGYDADNITKFGMYVYIAGKKQVEVSAATIDELKASVGKFYTTVTDIAPEQFDTPVFAIPFVVVGENVTYGSTSKATVNTNKWLGESK